jgi:hypothetical protein
MLPSSLVIQIPTQPADIPVWGVGCRLDGRPFAMTGPEQRRQARRQAEHVIRVSITSGSSRHTETARMVDISEGGMCFVGSRYLVPGTPLGIEFGECRIVAEVRHCRLREYGSMGQFVIGVQVQQILEGVETWLALTESAG